MSFVVLLYVLLSMHGGSTVLYKALKNYDLHIIYKFVLIMAGAFATGSIFITLYAISITSKSDLSGGVNKPLPDTVNNFSDLLVTLGSLTCLSLCLTLVLFILILFKFNSDNNNVKFNLHRFIGDKANNNLNYYFTKILAFISNRSVFYIYITFIIMLIAIIFNTYYLLILYNKLDLIVGPLDSLYKTIIEKKS